MPLILPLLASAGSAYLQYRGQKKQNERDEARNKELLSKNKAEAERRQKQVEGSFGMNKYQLEALEQSRSRQGVKEAQDQANLGAANQYELAARLGGRGGFSASAIERDRQNAVVKATADQRAQERAGVATAGRQKSNLDTLKRQYQAGRMTDAEQAAATAQQNLFNVEDNKANLGRNFATSLIDSAMPLLGSIGGGSGGAAGAGGGLSSGSGLDLGAQMMGSFNQSGGYQFPTGGFGSYNFGGGSGEQGMKTPGEFSHSSNPISLMQDGAKVGEVTGGEYVVNPSQAKKIAEQSAYARMLFKKFDKKA
jgi:hypothetical protein